MIARNDPHMRAKGAGNSVPTVPCWVLWRGEGGAGLTPERRKFLCAACLVRVTSPSRFAGARNSRRTRHRTKRTSPAIVFAL